MIKKVIGILLLVFSSVYLLGGVYLFYQQRTFVYQPELQMFDDCTGFEEYEKVNYQGTRFYLKPQSENVLVYYHGNAGSACSQSSVKKQFEATGYSLLFVEYAGYSNDLSAPSKDLLLNDVQNISDYVTARDYKKIIVYGQSLGSGAASYHAHIGRVDGVILLSPFSRLQDVAQDHFKIYPVALLFTEKFDNIAMLKNFKGPVLIFHGDQDRVILPEQSAKLFSELSTDDKQYIVVPEKNHFNMWGAEIVPKQILHFVDHVTFLSDSL